MIKKLSYFLIFFIPFVGFSGNHGEFHLIAEYIEQELVIEDTFLKSYCLGESEIVNELGVGELKHYSSSLKNSSRKVIKDRLYRNEKLTRDEFNHCVLINVAFEGCDLSHLDFEETIFINVIFKASYLNKNFRFIGSYQGNIIKAGMETKKNLLKSYVTWSKILDKTVTTVGAALGGTLMIWGLYSDLLSPKQKVKLVLGAVVLGMIAIETTT